MKGSDTMARKILYGSYYCTLGCSCNPVKRTGKSYWRQTSLKYHSSAFSDSQCHSSVVLCTVLVCWACVRPLLCFYSRDPTFASVPLLTFMQLRNLLRPKTELARLIVSYVSFGSLWLQSELFEPADSAESWCCPLMPQLFHQNSLVKWYILWPQYCARRL